MDFGESFDQPFGSEPFGLELRVERLRAELLRTVSGSAELTVEARVEPLSRAV